MQWIIYALLSAVFAALVSILAKLGLKDVSSNLATAVRTTVVLIFTWGIAFLKGETKDLKQIGGKTLVFLILSGIATGISWLFYFKALQLGKVSKVAPIDKLSTVLVVVFAIIFLKEEANLATIIGGLLIGIGTIVMTLNL